MSPEIILAGRALNDSMAKKVAEEFLLSMKRNQSYLLMQKF